MIRSAFLWHITPTDLGVEFLDPTDTVLTTDAALYQLVNDTSIPISKQDYSLKDYAALQRMRKFLHKVRTSLQAPAAFAEEFPNINGCIAKYNVTENISCYIMVCGIAVFFDKGQPIPIEDEKYFSLPLFYERQVYENDYCCNPETSSRKEPVYNFLQLLWSCVENKEFAHSSSSKYGNNGIAYTLCITMIDAPELVSNDIDLQMKKNFRALLETSAFNNILQKSHWELIKKRIDDDDISDLNILELSENLIFADNWSGVLIAGDLSSNEMCLRWFMDFELFLQSHWLLFDAYAENVVKTDFSPIELQGILNRVEVTKLILDNDISSNMEQCRHAMRRSLIVSSDINTIYQKMHGMVTNKLKLKLMSEEKKKSRFSLLSDLSLLIIAVLQIYGVIESFLTKTQYAAADFLSMGIMLFICVICVWFMIKGKL